MRRWLTWQQGRQGTGYRKCLLATFTWPVPWDLYLLDYPKDSFVPPHQDVVSEGRHIRCNLILKQATHGGHFLCPAMKVSGPRLFVFRPDLYVHQVTPVEEGRRWVLSFGFVLEAKHVTPAS